MISQRQHLLSERTELRRMLEEIPEEEILMRGSLSARLQGIEIEIAKLIETPEPARARLTFNGRPVVRSHGINADFGSKAISGFTESVTAMAASMFGPLGSRGRIPNRAQHQLLITNTAIGSFGFELEEYQPAQEMFDEPSAVAQALERTQSLLEGTSGTDDELADTIYDVDARVLERVRSFLQTLADHDAVCALQFGARTVRFSDVSQVRKSLQRLSTDNVRESESRLEGILQGVLPDGRVFELRNNDGTIIRGKIGPDVANPDDLNNLIHQRVQVRTMVRQVGAGRPRYLLLETPTLVQPS